MIYGIKLGQKDKYGLSGYLNFSYKIKQQN